ncbi:uncharacterized protein LOC142526074 [Primulina tabacum]|uniref:uncharacterized protein LOC142526074 n=1 Tax=Primulina tabacum TaxID=48773 RepID=UPI003F593A79
MSHSTGNSSSNSSSTSEDEVNVEIDEQAFDSVEEMMSLVLQQHQQLMESSQRRETRIRRRFIQRNCEAGHEKLVNDYFSTNPVCHDEIFRSRFRMRRELFLSIVNALENHSIFFQQRDDDVRRKRFSSLQKCTAAIRQLAYGVPADHLDEYLRMSESTVIKCLFKFCEYVVEIFGDRYLRRPNADDVERAFGVLQSRWAIVKGPAHYWYRKKLKQILLAYIILHNMIVEDEGGHVTNWYNDEGDELAQLIHGSNRGFQDYLRTSYELRDTQVHHQLRADLVEHIRGAIQQQYVNEYFICYF